MLYTTRCYFGSTAACPCSQASFRLSPFASRLSPLAAPQRCVTAYAAPAATSLPPSRPAQLRASIAVPTSSPPPTALQKFGRATWPFFALLEAVALTGCVVNGISTRKRRVELAALNAQLRNILAKLAASEAARVEYSGDAYTPAGEATAAGKRALAAGSLVESAAAFTKADTLALAAGDSEAQLAALKGLAASQLRQGATAGAVATLLRALSLSKGQDAAVLGSLGDAYAELGELEKAGTYYDMYLHALD